MPLERVAAEDPHLTAVNDIAGGMPAFPVPAGVEGGI
jgi:hypothetical protein